MNEAPSVSVNPRALGARIEAIARANGKVSSMWASGRAADRFDIYYADASGAERVMRVDGVGGILREVSADALVAGGGIFNALTKIHESLLAGETGSWIVGISGALLLVNLMLGLKLAWPRTGTWRGSLYGRPGGPRDDALLPEHGRAGELCDGPGRGDAGASRRDARPVCHPAPGHLGAGRGPPADAAALALHWSAEVLNLVQGRFVQMKVFSQRGHIARLLARSC